MENSAKIINLIFATFPNMFIFFIYLTYSADSRRVEELPVALKEEVEKADWSFKTCGSFLRPGR